MHITLTSLQLRSLWGFFRLSWYGLNISLQAKKTTGFIQMKNTGFGYLHYTMSSWQSQAAMTDFAKSGVHLKAIKQSSSIASEIRIHSFEGDKMPSWDEAKLLISKDAKIFTYV
jgi:heme-degrading monooxygenase HmoA